MNERIISVLFEEDYFYAIIQKRCKNHGFSISKATLGNIVSKEGKHCHGLASEGKILPITYSKKKHSSFNIAKVKFLILNENPLTQRYVVNTLNYPVSFLNKAVNSNLDLKLQKM